MVLFGRGAQASVNPKWNDASLGLTEADFRRWPGRYAPKRATMIPRIETLVTAGSVQLPVRLIGQCTSYDRKDGHPAYPQMRHDLTDFVVAGTSKPTVVTFHKGADVISGFEPSETVMQTMNDYIDLQFLTAEGMPCGRIGFYTDHGHAEEAKNLARLVGMALK